MANLIQLLAGKYRNLRKKDFLEKPLHYKNSYAIIGTGHHAITNLYPCLWHLGVPVKCICSSNKSNAINAALRWPGCTGTNNINDILNDESIKGVIVCVDATLQKELTRQLLEKGKNVFVEKPVAYSLASLKELIAVQKELVCQVGLQRRFSKVSAILKKYTNDAISYNYRFVVGAYPDGDVLYELFIHPIDFVIDLFGEARLEHVSTIGSGHSQSHLITLSHKSIRGTLELSSDYSWNQAVDEIIINTKDKVFTGAYPYSVTGTTKPSTLLSIPIEKITGSFGKQTQYMNANNFVPTAESSSHNLLGFYPELKYFFQSVEHNKRGKYSQLDSLIPVYELMELLNNS
jgi:virulence factor